MRLIAVKIFEEASLCMTVVCLGQQRRPSASAERVLPRALHSGPRIPRTAPEFATAGGAMSAASSHSAAPSADVDSAQARSGSPSPPPRPSSRQLSDVLSEVRARMRFFLLFRRATRSPVAALRGTAHRCAYASWRTSSSAAFAWCVPPAASLSLARARALGANSRSKICALFAERFRLDCFGVRVCSLALRLTLSSEFCLLQFWTRAQDHFHEPVFLPCHHTFCLGAAWRAFRVAHSFTCTFCFGLFRFALCFFFFFIRYLRTFACAMCLSQRFVLRDLCVTYRVCAISCDGCRR